MFSPPIDIKEALVQHTQCPCRFVILAKKNALYSHKLRDRHIYMLRSIYYIYISRIQDTRCVHTRYIHTSKYMRVASVGCFSGAWRRGSWHFQVASLDLSLFASHYFSFLSKRSGRRSMPPAERSALYTSIKYRQMPIDDTRTMISV